MFYFLFSVRSNFATLKNVYKPIKINKHMKTEKEIYQTPGIDIFEVVSEQAFAQSNIIIDEWGNETEGEW